MYPPVCQECGACCFSDSDSYVELNEADLARLGRDAGALAWTDDRGDSFLKMEQRHCAALEARRGRFACTIYPRRPRLCHALEYGSPECQEEYRLKKGWARRASR